MKFIQTLKNIWTIQELRQRLTITVLLVLVYRLVTPVLEKQGLMAPQGKNKQR